MRASRITLLCAVTLAVTTIAAYAVRAPGGASGDGGGKTATPAPEVASAAASTVASTPAPAVAPAPAADLVARSAVERPAARVAKRASTPESGSPDHGAAPAPAGMVVGIDPETGQLGMPTPEQMRALAPPDARLGHTPEGFEMVQRPDGAVGIRVGTQLHEYAFAQIMPDGRIVRGCFIPGPHTHEVTEIPAPAPRYEEK